jgi:glycosyltransferase involved in cell wall biosynthesis
VNEVSHEPLVSVIMIFLNAGDFIQEAIDSVRAQTYTHWELVLVNDGSSDDSTAVAWEAARQEPRRVRYMQHRGRQNQGMSASRNVGIQRSQGAYLAFLDADDVYCPEKLERQVASLTAHPNAGMAYGDTEYWHSWTGRPEDRARDRRRKLGIAPERLYAPPELVTRYMRNTASTPGTGSVLIRREAAAQVGGFERDFSGMFEDQVFFHKICLQFPVYVESGCWARYRQHTASWCQVKLRAGEWSRDGRPTRAKAAFLVWLEGYWREKQVTDPQLWRLLRRAQWPYQYPTLYRMAAPLRHCKPLLSGLRQKIVQAPLP